jgi:hypothetical protein
MTLTPPPFGADLPLNPGDTTMKTYKIASHPLVSPYIVPNFCLRVDARAFADKADAAARLYALATTLPGVPAGALLALVEGRATYRVERGADGEDVGILTVSEPGDGAAA